MYICMYVCVCVHINIYIYVYTYICECVCVYLEEVNKKDENSNTNNSYLLSCNYLPKTMLIPSPHENPSCQITQNTKKQ